MTKIILSHEDYARVLREGLDLDAYLRILNFQGDK